MAPAISSVLPSPCSQTDLVCGLPAALGFRMPAEWEPQAAIWLSWPVRRATWPGHYEGIPEKFAQIVAVISRYQQVHVNVAQANQAEAHARFSAAGAKLERVHLHDHATNDTWCRDHGPIFVRHGVTGEVAAIDWDFNAWGRKFEPFDADDAIPAQVAAALGVRRFKPGIVLEGGSIDVNGQGELLTTEACLLNPNRNPQLGRSEIETYLRNYLGVRQIHWLGRGLEGDDTDGHVDDLCRFFSPNGIVTTTERNPRDANQPALAENLERLRALRDTEGRAFTIVEVPQPEPCVTDGQRLPASYVNFLILNQAVLVPVFGQARRDAEALAVLTSCFPGRELVPIDCRQWVIGRGTLHCISQQQPACVKKDSEGAPSLAIGKGA